jgi:hypothetical protein
MLPKPPFRFGAVALGAFALCVAAASFAASDAETEGLPEELPYEVIDLKPDDLASFGMKNVAAPLASIFRGFGHYYGERKILIDTTPSGGMVDLFYVRSNFQKRFEQAETPVMVLLPSRVNAGPRDAMTIRAFREGFRQQQVSIKISSKVDRITLDLEPLPNRLDGLSHRYFAGRSTIGFLTKESLMFRLQEREDGVAVVLTETAMSPEAAASLERLRSPLVTQASGQQLGEDLVVQVSLSEAARNDAEFRSRQEYNAARDLHEFTLELVPKDGGARSVEAALAALASVGPADVTGCALDFDSAVREHLDAGALSRALSPQGSFIDRYIRAAMRRLGEVTPGGVVVFTDGSRYSPKVPIELEVSLSRAAQAQGLLSLLKKFVYGLEDASYRAETYRGLVAPELDPASFEVVLEQAEAVRASCVAAL